MKVVILTSILMFATTGLYGAPHDDGHLDSGSYNIAIGHKVDTPSFGSGNFCYGEGSCKGLNRYRSCVVDIRSLDIKTKELIRSHEPMKLWLMIEMTLEGQERLCGKRHVDKIMSYEKQLRSDFQLSD